MAASSSSATITPTDKGLFDRLTLGAAKSLEKRQGVTDVSMKQFLGTTKSNIQLWEQNNSCILPDDLKDFYLTNNGFFLRWNVRINESLIPVGKMEVNPLEKLKQLGCLSKAGPNAPPTAVDVESDEDDDTDFIHPKFDHRSRIFELDPCDGYGKTCLVYNNTKQGIPASKCDIWFMDRSLQWHYLADSFLSYYRLMLLHLGLPQWQYAFTPLGLSPQARQWFNMYAPARLDYATGLQMTPEIDENIIKNRIDSSKVFKGKSDKRKVTQPQNPKKKPGAPSAKGPGQSLMKTGGTSSLAKPPNK